MLTKLLIRPGASCADSDRALHPGDARAVLSCVEACSNKLYALVKMQYHEAF